MKKRITILVGILSIIGIVGCAETSDNDYEQPEIIVSSEDEEQIDEELLVPEHISDIYERLATVISQGTYDIALGDKVGIDDREEDYTYYRISLCPSDPDILHYPYLEFYSDNENTDQSFTVYGMELCENNVIKEIIYCTLAATTPELTHEEIDVLKDELVNSYSEFSRSDIVETEHYKYFLEWSKITEAIELEAVAKDEINVAVDKTLYSEFTKEEMLAELNSGELAIISGVVAYDTEETYHNTLWVVNGNERYDVYYSPTSYPDYFQEDEEYVFYGSLAKSHDSKTVCLQLHYCENVSSTQ